MKKVTLFATLVVCIFGLHAVGKSADPLEEDFIFPESHLRELYQNDFYSLGYRQPTLEVLEIARNEIYARKGYIFQSEELNAFFRSKFWYEPLSSDPIKLTSIEKYNVGLIRFYEHCLKKAHQPVSQNRQQEQPQQPAQVVCSSRETVLEDLNGDGRQDTLLYVQDNWTFLLTINGDTCKGRGENLVDSFAIVDIDIEDRFKEVVISALGPSDDPSSTFFFYDDNCIEKIGETYSLFISGIEMDGHGNLNVHSRGAILQTWFFNIQYRLEDNHHIQLIEGNIYTTSQSLYLKTPLTLFTDRNENSPTFTIDQYSIIELAGTDNKRWCLVRAEDGREGWFYVDHHLHINGSGKRAYETLYGLCGAD